MPIVFAAELTDPFKLISWISCILPAPIICPSKYTLICYTAKAKPDRGLVNGKTGTELVWEWLKKYDMDKFVTKVTAEKPRAVAYIDDKGITFTDWKQTLRELNV